MLKITVATPQKTLRDPQVGNHWSNIIYNLFYSIRIKNYNFDPRKYTVYKTPVICSNIYLSNNFLK